MGWLYDAALYDRVTERPLSVRDETGRLNKFPALRQTSPPPTSHPGREGLPSSYAEAFRLHPRTELVAGSDPVDDRLSAFGKHYGINALYRDYREMIASERLDIVAIASRADLRPDATQCAVAQGALGVITEKPMAEHLQGADRMVEACAQAEVPLVCGAISVNHPAFAKAREIIDGGAIGNVLSFESPNAHAQHNSWIYLLDRSVAWVVGVAAEDDAVRANEEFRGAGLIQFGDGVFGCVRPGAANVRISGDSGELIWNTQKFHLWQDLLISPTACGVNRETHSSDLKKPDPPSETTRVEVPYPDPQMVGEWSVIYGIDDLIGCMETGDEPRVSGRRVRDSMEIEIALRESHRLGNEVVKLPLKDRSLGIKYPYFR